MFDYVSLGKYLEGNLSHILTRTYTRKMIDLFCPWAIPNRYFSSIYFFNAIFTSILSSPYTKHNQKWSTLVQRFHFVEKRIWDYKVHTQMYNFQKIFIPISSLFLKIDNHHYQFSQASYSRIYTNIFHTKILLTKVYRTFLSKPSH